MGGRHARSRVLRRTRRGRIVAVHHFVNGGGGAYLSFGTALSWPAAVPTADWAHYPNRQAVADKIEAHTPLVEAAGVVVDDQVRCLAVFGRVAVGGLRLQRRAVLSELRRSEGRAVGRPRARRAVRRPRAADMERPRRVRQPAAARCRRTRVGRMVDSDDALTAVAHGRASVRSPCAPSRRRVPRRQSPTATPSEGPA